MEHFTFSHTSEDGTVTSVDFKTDRWFEAFPHFINLMNGVGFSVRAAQVYAPEVAKFIAEEFDYMYIPEEVVDTEPKLHSKHYYEYDRNK